MTDEDFKLVDPETYKGSGEKLSFRQIVLQHLSHITDLSRQNNFTHQYSNAINCLYDLLYPMFDKKIIKEAKDINEQHKKLKEEYKGCSEFGAEIEIYWNEHFGLKRELLRALTSFLHRKRYLEMKSFEEKE